jgi:hypothetical protein
MGDNKVLLRSPVEGDVDRLLKSKNECIKYYFSDLKPWNPGLVATQREVWVQIYGIPLHIWGENLFKIVGKRLGEFMDYDEETARMLRFDVARIKIQTTIWAFIDVVLKVEVEGLSFDIWVVEEKERKRPVVVLNGEMEDESSRVFPAGCLEEGDEVSGGRVSSSGADEESGEENEADMVTGEGIEVEKDGTKVIQSTNEGVVALTCAKSIEFRNSNMEIPCAPQVETEKVHQEACLDSDFSEKEGGKDKPGVSGPILVEETVGLDLQDARNGADVEILNDVAGLQDPGLNPTGLGLVDPDPPFLGVLVEDGIIRDSSLSEPEETLSPFRSINPRHNHRNKKLNSLSNANNLGVPKCIKLVEAVKEMGARVKQRRQKGGEGISTMREDEEDVAGLMEVEVVEASEDGDADQYRRKGEGREAFHGVSTPASRINLLSGSETSRVSDSLPQSLNEDKDKYVEAAKLLSIQKNVGFSFVEATSDTLKHLVEQENCDRIKKMEWELKEGDQ